MPTFKDREPFIPLRKQELIDLLCGEGGFADFAMDESSHIRNMLLQRIGLGFLSFFDCVGQALQ